jgi:hypothetical protein
MAKPVRRSRRARCRAAAEPLWAGRMAADFNRDMALLGIEDVALRIRKTKLSFDLFAQQHGNDGLFARFYRHLPTRSLSRGHSFEVSKYEGKNEVYPDLIQSQKISPVTHQAECISCGPSKRTKQNRRSARQRSRYCSRRRKLHLQLIPEFHYSFAPSSRGFLLTSALALLSSKDERWNAHRRHSRSLLSSGPERPHGPCGGFDRKEWGRGFF